MQCTTGSRYQSRFVRNSIKVSLAMVVNSVTTDNVTAQHRFTSAAVDDDADVELYHNQVLRKHV